MPYPLPPALKLIAYLSGLTVDVLVSGAVHVRVNAVLLPVMIKFVGAPMAPAAWAFSECPKSKDPATRPKTINVLSDLFSFPSPRSTLLTIIL